MARSATPPPVWCRPAQDGLQQGDLLLDFTVRRPVADEGVQVIQEAAMDLVVLTQSCDLLKAAQDHVLVACVYPFDYALTKWSNLRETDYRKALTQGTAVSDFLLPPAPPSRGGWMIAHYPTLLGAEGRGRGGWCAT